MLKESTIILQTYEGVGVTFKRLFILSSVRGKTLLTILPLIILTLVVMTIISYKYSESLLNNEIQNKMTAKLDGTINDIKQQLSEHSTLVQGLVSTVEATGNNLTTEQYSRVLGLTQI
jgi:methyl-accepting chemotaxis protein